MPKLVDLKAKPYNLSDKQVAWVNETIAGMTDEEKIGQLFTNLFFFGNDAFSGNDFTNQEIVEKFHIGGARYHGNSKEDIQDLLNELQSMSKIPLLVAANCDSGDPLLQCLGEQRHQSLQRDVATLVGDLSRPVKGPRRQPCPRLAPSAAARS